MEFVGRFCFRKQKEKNVKINLEELLKSLGLPIGLVALFSAVLGLIGIQIETVLLIAEGLIGTFALIALLINVLKWAGVVTDENAGRWSAAANLAVIIAVALIFKLFPSFDFVSVDAQLGEFARVVGVVFAYVVQVVGSKGVHVAMTQGLGIKAFSLTKQAATE
jgi:hypothetical protein